MNEAAEPPGDPRQRSSVNILDRWNAVRERIAVATAAAGRSDSVELIVVTKFHPIEAVIPLLEAGQRELGENRAQDAAAKFEQLGDEHANLAEQVRWNMIGGIQTKKAPAVALWADRVHSVDSVRVAQGLDRGRRRRIDGGTAHGPVPVMLQLSLDADGSRFGVPGESLLPLAHDIAELENLSLSGLMVVPPVNGDPAVHFARASEARERLRQDFPLANSFSAGMSGDLETAIAAGSTCVRVGTSILGARPIR